MNQIPTPTRYALSLRLLHWLLALMIVVALAAGSVVLEHTPNSDPHKLDALRIHMMVGMGIGVLMLIRVIIRLVTAQPEPMDTGNALINIAGKLVHGLLYVLIFAMVGSGIALSLMAGLPDIVFGGNGALPADFHDFAPRAVHGIVAKVLIGLIVLHVLAALYHHFIRKDGALFRMGFGK